jgi:hypothetical protein
MIACILDKGIVQKSMVGLCHLSVKSKTLGIEVRFMHAGADGSPEEHIIAQAIEIGLRTDTFGK